MIKTDNFVNALNKLFNIIGCLMIYSLPPNFETKETL